MGERKGQNLYYPPDYDPRAGGLNKFQGTHALRERARKLHMGILIIRFEMPYNIWCDGCNNHIGMGVRYNAEKKKIGMYYTTPVYQFRMKCHLCNNHFEIKTDPGNLDYVIVSGARRQENRWDPTDNEQIVPETKETQKRLFDDPMFKLEHKSGDIKAANNSKPRIGKLVARNESVWKDNYEVNSLLRKSFRNKSKELQSLNQSDQALLQKSSLDIQLLPECDEDRHMASLLSLKPAYSINEKQAATRNDIINSNVLPSSSGLIASFGGLKKEKLLSQTKQLTRGSLGISIKTSSIGNTRDMQSNVNETLKEADKRAVGQHGSTKIESQLQTLESESLKMETRDTESSDVIDKLDKTQTNVPEADKIGLKRKLENLEVEAKKTFVLCDYDSTSSESSS